MGQERISQTLLAALTRLSPHHERRPPVRLPAFGSGPLDQRRKLPASTPDSFSAAEKGRSSGIRPRELPGRERRGRSTRRAGPSTEGADTPTVGQATAGHILPCPIAFRRRKGQGRT